MCWMRDVSEGANEPITLRYHKHVPVLSVHDFHLAMDSSTQSARFRRLPPRACHVDLLDLLSRDLSPTEPHQPGEAVRLMNQSAI